MRSLFEEEPSCVVQPIVAFTSDEEIGGKNGAVHVKEHLNQRGIQPEYVVTGEVSNLELIIRRRNLLQSIITFDPQLEKQRGKLESREFRTHIHRGDSLHAAYFNSEKDQHALIQATKFVLDHEVTMTSIEGEFLKSNSIPRVIRLTYVIPDPTCDETHTVDRALTGFLKAISEIANTSLPVKAPSDYGVTITPNIIEYTDSKFRAWFDIRAMTNDKDEVKRILKSILEKHLSAFDITTKCSGHFIYTPENAPLVRAARTVLEQNNLTPQLLERGGATDGRHFATQGAQVIDLGPIGGNLHGSNEWVDKDSLLKLVELYATLPQALDSANTNQGKS